MPNDQRKALITGGAGFIGSHLADHLLTQGTEVWVLDNLSTGRLENITHLAAHPAFHFVEGSVTDESILARLMTQVDVVYHLAASVGVKLIVERLVESIENNVRGTEMVLRAANQARKKVLLTSTSEVYGRGHQAIFSETDDLTMGPTTISRWSYACSKALDEYLAFAYSQEHGLPVTVVRLFNTVGERQSDAYGMVVPTFVRQALAGEPLTIHGTGKQSRCFCHVSDVVHALHALMEHPKSVGNVYNVGSTESVTIEELADRVIALTKSQSPKLFIPYEEAYRKGFEDIDRRLPDISRLEALINFKPSLALDDIILRVQESLIRTLGREPEGATVSVDTAPVGSRK